MPTLEQLEYLSNCMTESPNVDLDGAAKLQHKLDTGRAVLYENGPSIIDLEACSNAATDHLGFSRFDLTDEEVEDLAVEYHRDNLDKAVSVHDSGIGAVILSFGVKIDGLNMFDIEDGVVVGHDTEIIGTSVGSGSFIGANSIIKHSRIGANNTIHGELRAMNSLETDDDVIIGLHTEIGTLTDIGKGVVIGHSSKILGDVLIGDRAKIGNYSVVVSGSVIDEGEELPMLTIRLPKESEDRVSYSNSNDEDLQ